MSFQDKPREPREPRAPRKARARISLKMQAIGFLSRREHSRQELRAKLLDALRKRAREEAAVAAATDRTARELAQALSEQPSNGIDDAFAPMLPVQVQVPVPVPVPVPVIVPAAREAAGARTARTPARAAERTVGPAQAPAGTNAGDACSAAHATRVDRPGLDTLSLANGAPLPAALRASLAAAAAASKPPEAAARRFATASSSTDPRASAEHRVVSLEGFDAFIDVDVDADLVHSHSSESAGQASVDLDASDREIADPEAAVDELLDWLVANQYLSETRFVESRVNARSRKQGTLLIKLELSRHGLALEPEQVATLRETEFARAQALWQRKFGEIAPDARLRAKQARFLAARGFAADVVRRVVGGLDED
jgi:regulatory protein